MSFLLLTTEFRCEAQNYGNWQPVANIGGTAIGFGNGKFVAGGAISSDGTNWTPVSIPVNEVYAITYGNGLYVAVGGDGGLFPGGNFDSAPQIATSKDGTNWDLRVSSDNFTFSGSASLYGVIYSNGLFVAVGGDAFTPNAGIILTSSNGTNWTQRSAGSASGLSSVTFGKGLFVAVGHKTTDGFSLSHVELTSTTGTAWTQLSTAAPNLGLAFGGGVFVALTDDNYILRATDGKTWTLASSTDGNLTLHEVIYANKQFVAVGESPLGGEVWSSPDGTNWSLAFSDNDSCGFYSVAYGNGHFEALGCDTYRSELSFVTPDTQLPVLSITAPTNNQRLKIPSLSIKGTATDNVGVAAVYFRLNTNAWTVAGTTNGFTNWNNTIGLLFGTNSLKAYAADLFGNFSTTSSVSFYSSNQFVMLFTNQPSATRTGLLMTLNVSTGMTCRIDVSTNLQTWSMFTNFTSTNLSMKFRDPAATNPGQRFYRGVVP